MTVRRALLRPLHVTALAAVAALCGTRSTAVAAPAEDAKPIVVMISLDGLGGYYLDDPKAEMPTLRAIAKEGARASGMRASTPTVTWPNHTTLVTGCEPARHGVVGNNYYDRATDAKVQLIADPVFDKEQIVKVPTIYDVAKAAGMTTAAVRWPASRNAKHLDWQVPDCSSDDLLEKYTTPALMAECKEAGIWGGGPVIDGKLQRLGDEGRAKAFNLILRKHRPQLALLHLADVDHQEHLNGPQSPAAYAAIKKVDSQVKEVWDELKRDYAGRASLVIVSDHGFSAIERAVLPNVILRDAGLVKVKGQRIVSGQVRVVPQGGAALVYVTDEANRAAVIERVRKAFTGAQHIRKVIASEDFASIGVADPKVDPHAPDVVLLCDEGCVFGDTAAGAMTFQEKPERKGSHGHDRELPDLHATFVAWGRGIKPGTTVGVVHNTDVAPTLAKLLGVEMPGTDGKPIDGVLAR